jgi:uncharacterized SAM-binding protein YcdF (DUF218 family)
MEALIVIALLWVFWLASSRRWRRRIIQPLMVVVILFMLVASPLMVNVATWGLTFSVPPDTGETVDAIVVLGRGHRVRNERFEIAKELWEDNRAPKIFISGMLDAKYMVPLLQEVGIPASALSGEECSQSTTENGLFTMAILRPQGIHKILLITDPPHLLRSLLIFRTAGFTVIPHASPLPAQWGTKQRLLTVVREYAALAKYALSDRLHPQTSAAMDSPPTEVSAKILDWNCRVQGTEDST